VFILIGQALVTIQPIMFGRIVSSVTEQDQHMFLFALLSWVFLAVSKSVVFYVKELFELKKFEFELPRHLSRISMRKFFSISMGQHTLGHSVIKRNVISKGEAASIGTVFQVVYEIIPITLSILLPIIFLFVNVWQVGVCVLGAIIIFTAYTLTYNQRFVPRMRSLDTLYNQIGKRQGEFVTNVDVVYANAQEEHARTETDTRNAKGALM
jgi:ABC-type multidrug transport system fused ATPase/permease subunit